MCKCRTKPSCVRQTSFSELIAQSRRQQTVSGADACARATAHARCRCVISRSGKASDEPLLHDDLSTGSRSRAHNMAPCALRRAQLLQASTCLCLRCEVRPEALKRSQPRLINNIHRGPLSLRKPHPTAAAARPYGKQNVSSSQHLDWTVAAAMPPDFS